MKDDKNKIKEPYPAENTPNPPQIIDPSVRKERDQNDQPVENKRREPVFTVFPGLIRSYCRQVDW
jgi:hypothetical protein